MNLTTKVLWVEELDGPNTEKQMLDNAHAIAAKVLCIRTMSTYLATAIQRYKNDLGFKVYGW